MMVFEQFFNIKICKMIEDASLTYSLRCQAFNEPQITRLPNKSALLINLHYWLERSKRQQLPTS